ncbi:MAG: carbon monoxide dehydrogenase [Methanosarcinales archaeon]|nr:carbon monoxide dehydrogenase [Methanosarcinales archaeon]
MSDISDIITLSTRSEIQPANSGITLLDHWDHLKARWGVNRSGHRVEPGLYALCSPAPDSPVLVTANYTLSFDKLRSSLKGIDCYILVLDTRGINVWCAAGKGTFGTGEMVHRIKATGLHDVVNHRVLILPQLGATGVAAHEVKKQSGFKVEYGPVRSEDLPDYLKTHKADPEMRKVHFTLPDRVVLIPVDFVKVLLPMILAAFLLFLVGEYLMAAGIVVAVMAGVVLFPILLPWLPTSDFSSKGFILGGLVALAFAAFSFFGDPQVPGWLRAGWVFIYMLLLPPITAFLALNFTGSTTFTSVTGVRREIFTYVPVMGYMFGSGFLLMIILTLIQISGGL